MTAGQAFAITILLLGILSPAIALGAYSFGWWYRGRFERMLRAELEAKDDDVE